MTSSSCRYNPAILASVATGRRIILFHISDSQFLFQGPWCPAQGWPRARCLRPRAGPSWRRWTPWSSPPSTMSATSSAPAAPGCSGRPLLCSRTRMRSRSVENFSSANIVYVVLSSGIHFGDGHLLARGHGSTSKSCQKDLKGVVGDAA